MIDVGYQHIHPTPDYPENITAADLVGKPWLKGGHKVETFKEHLKKDLRKIQLGRCCYCRRHLGDPRDTQLEHFLEQAVFNNLRFEIQNLGLSCSTCNGKKNGYHKHLQGKVQKWRKRFKTAPTHTIVPGICGSSGGCGADLTDEYRLVHPHHHRYSEHIQIKKSWVYQPKTPKGNRTVRGLKLNLLGEVERSVRLERMFSQPGLLGLFAQAWSASDKTAASDLFRDLAQTIKEKKKRNGSIKIL